MPNEAESLFRDALNEALKSLKGVGGNAAAQLVDKYAPRFAALATRTPEDAQAEYDDLIVNLEADEDVNAIDAQAAGAGFAMAVLKIAAKLARSMVLPAVP